MTRDKIKKAALSLFVKNGYEGAHVAEIAKAVNIKTASLYFHFESKEKLFLEIFYDLLHEKLKSIEAANEFINQMDSVQEQLFFLYTDYYKWVDGYQDEMVFWKRTALFPPSFLEDQIRKELITYEQRYVAVLLEPVFLKGMALHVLKDQDVNRLIVGFLGLMAAVFSEIHYSEPAVYQKKLEILWENFWDSIKK
ncbi:TetR/AcrR family transcriptional regulator [Candidatus Formimonas warabiya]|uniref:HTH tetR-type domain-containing protein n=1 Tax=Formimonas warabiya TaxID=1761012 RepID=A0A3G1L019_FORW1|nr:TetR/AcrR family transcriptional regulator [Candidatus Formimonas warabiya]ATW27989.1 hypothetical protein DCMF_27445 [Candidatus Formimonas warabiya]